MFDLISAQETFDQAYLAALRKSELEVISDMLVRDIRMARTLPREQRVALANMLRDKADGLDMIEEKVPR
jgi:hypothetical protein